MDFLSYVFVKFTVFPHFFYFYYDRSVPKSIHSSSSYSFKKNLSLAHFLSIRGNFEICFILFISI